MPTYEFFSSEGPKGKFVASNKAIRSHAMKTALRMRPGRGDASESLISPNNSEEIIRRKDELTRRFRLTKKPKKGDEAKPEGKKSKVVRRNECDLARQDYGQERKALYRLTQRF